MSLYCVNIDGREYRVNIAGKQTTVNGEPVKSGLQPLNKDGLHLMRRGNQALEVYLNPQDAETYQVLVNGRRMVSRVQQNFQRSKRMQNQENVNALRQNDIIAPMHGLVIDILVSNEDEVDEGQPLAVIEAMKMQMTIRSPRAGKVTQIKTQPGKQVEKGASLIRLEN